MYSVATAAAIADHPRGAITAVPVTRELILEVGRVYRAKHPRLTTDGLVNDRIIMFGNREGVQFDSPAVRDDQPYPFVTIAEFMDWAGHDVTAQFGADLDWHGAAELKQWQQLHPGRNGGV